MNTGSNAEQSGPTFDVGFVPVRMKPPVQIVNSASNLVQGLGNSLETHIQSQILPSANFVSNVKGLIQGNIKSGIETAGLALGDIKARMKDGINSGTLQLPANNLSGITPHPGLNPPIVATGYYYPALDRCHCTIVELYGNDYYTQPGYKTLFYVIGPAFPDQQSCSDYIHTNYRLLYDGYKNLCDDTACAQNPILGPPEPLPPILNPPEPPPFIPGPIPQPPNPIVVTPIPPPPPPPPPVCCPPGNTIVNVPSPNVYVTVLPDPPTPIDNIINVTIPPPPPQPPPPPEPSKPQATDLEFAYGDQILIPDAKNLTGPSFCERFLIARDVTADYGLKLISYTTSKDPGKLDIQSLFGKIRNYISIQEPIGEGSHAVLEFFKSLTNDVTIVRIESNFRKWIGEVYTDASYNKVDGLYAVRLILQALNNWKVDISANNDFSYTFSAKGTPQIFGFGAGVDTQVTDGTKANHATEIQPAFSSSIEILDLMIKITLGQTLPSISDTITGYLHGDVTLAKVKCLIQYNGGQWTEYIPIINAARKQLSADQVIEIGLRQGKVPKDITDGLRNLGYIDKNDQSALVELYNEIPPINTIVSFSFNGVTNEAIATKYNLDEGFNEAWQSNLGIAAQTQGITFDWFKLYWRNHWQKLSTQESADAARRLRPGRVGDNLSFTQDDYYSFTQRNGVPKYLADRLQQLAYTPIPIRYLKLLYESGIIDDTELKDFIIDAGYSPDNSDLYKQSLIIQARRDLSTKGITQSLKDGVDSYFTGVLSLDDLNTLGRYLGYTNDQIGLAIESHENQFDTKIAKQRIMAVQKEFVHGAIDEITARTKLAEREIAPNHVDLYIDLWTEEIKSDTKAITVHTLIDWFKRGIISIDNLTMRLYQLHFTPDDVGRIELTAIQDMQKSLEKEQAKELAAQQKQKEKLLKEYLAQRAKDLAASARQAKEAARQASVLAAKAAAKALADQKQKKRDESKLASEAASQASKLQRALIKQMLAEVRGEYDESVAAIRAEETIELSTMTDKVEKATLRADIDNQLAELKEQELNLEASIETGLPIAIEEPEQ